VIKRQSLAVVTGLSAIALSLILFPELFEAVLFRFTDLYSKIKIGTVLTRFELWQNAFNAFWEHPLVGIGPGNYKVVHSIYPAIRLEFIFFFIQGMNAHNLLLHYMAETGVVGTTAMLALIFNQLRTGRQGWRESFGLKNVQIAGALYITSIMFAVTTILEAAWFWGFAGFTFVFFLALIVNNHRAVARI
jgi:O-antigen ligase